MGKPVTSSGLTPEQKIERIERACLHGGGTHTWEDFRAGIVDGRFQIFDNDHGVCITEIVQAPQHRYLHCWIVAGELPGVMDLQGRVVRHARENGCRHLNTIGRLGWQKVLPDYGWKRTGVVFARSVDHG